MELLSSPQQFLRRAPHINTKIAEAWGQNGWFRNYRLCARQRSWQTFATRPFSIRGMDGRPPSTRSCVSGATEGDIQLQSL